MSSQGWIGVDLDGTLARYEGWSGVEHIGEPIAPMVARVRQWIAEGRDVRIFTARIASRNAQELYAAIDAIEKWCARHIGTVLPITNIKDFAMTQLWDDRAVQVVPNEGRRADGALE
jgi:hypothetical protein